MSLHGEDEISDDVVAPEGRVWGLGSIIEATVSHRRSVLGALGSAGIAGAGSIDREDLLQKPEGASND